uniref:Protein TAPT1 homolog n=1 Tax=Strigamia maritima TaxID=126957 RepID=T1JP60_STRMM
MAVEQPTDSDVNEEDVSHRSSGFNDIPFMERIQDIQNGENDNFSNSESHAKSKHHRKNVTFMQYFLADLTRGYLLENDGSRYAERREKVYAFMKMPREVEKFMAYGFFQCVDAFLFVFTFLPLRILLALWFLLQRLFHNLLRNSSKRYQPILQPAEICDLLKGITMITCGFLISYIDTAMMYHLIKSQSVIKLYIFFNMLEVADRLFSAFGQDLLDTLFWTATEPRGRKREHFGVIPHLILAILYNYLNTATTLNVAINASNKALLTIMISNNFVELKGSVFKKFEKNNLFQMLCSDVRERFHYVLLLVAVTIQTMKEYSWKEERFWILLPDCLMVLLSEFLVDWVKHAFITRFNEISLDVYKDYTVSLAYDVATSKHKHAFSDHSDLVSRRMGFIPLPLGILMFRIVNHLISFKVVTSIVLLGKACDLIEQHRTAKLNHSETPSPKPVVQRAKSHPPSRKASFERLSTPGGLVHSVSLLHPSHLLGSLGDVTAQMESQRSMGPRPLFSNSTVSINSLGLNETILPEGTEVSSETQESTPAVEDRLQEAADELCHQENAAVPTAAKLQYTDP